MFENLLREVSAYKAFYTVDELNASSDRLAREHPDRVKILDIGKSRKREKIKALRIGKGKKTALLFAFPHPNEPIGSMTLEYLSQRLAKDNSLDKLEIIWEQILTILLDQYFAGKQLQAIILPRREWKSFRRTWAI